MTDTPKLTDAQLRDMLALECKAEIERWREAAAHLVACADCWNENQDRAAFDELSDAITRIRFISAEVM